MTPKFLKGHRTNLMQSFQREYPESLHIFLDLSTVIFDPDIL